MKNLAWIAVAGTLLVLIVMLGVRLLGEQGAYAQGTINFDVDPNPTGNTPSTLGTVEGCYRVNVNEANFGDGAADVTIDIVVAGDTQAPIAYDAYLVYTEADVNPVTWLDTSKLAPGAVPFTTKAPPQLNAGALYFVTPGNGLLATARWSG